VSREDPAHVHVYEKELLKCVCGISSIYNIVNVLRH
jgi:hypothetical protein